MAHAHGLPPSGRLVDRTEAPRRARHRALRGLSRNPTNEGTDLLPGFPKPPRMMGACPAPGPVPPTRPGLPAVPPLRTPPGEPAPGVHRQEPTCPPTPRFRRPQGPDLPSALEVAGAGGARGVWRAKVKMTIDYACAGLARLGARACGWGAAVPRATRCTHPPPLKPPPRPAKQARLSVPYPMAPARRTSCMENTRCTDPASI